MYKEKSLAIIVPVYNEELLIEKTIRNIPSYVDCVYVVDDKSTDNSFSILKKLSVQNRSQKPLITLIHHNKNEGVGAAITTGYKAAICENIDLAVVMAGDGQMDPEDLPTLLDPLINHEADYVKGNRLITKDVREVMPGYRYFGNSILTLLTKISSGYWHVMDPQCGYTAITISTLKVLPLDLLYKRYGYPNDLLTKLNVYNFRVKDVPVRAIYGEERSKIRFIHIFPKSHFFSLRIFSGD